MLEELCLCGHQKHNHHQRRGPHGAFSGRCLRLLTANDGGPLCSCTCTQFTPIPRRPRVTFAEVATIAAYAVAGLQLVTGIAYLCNGQPRNAIVWVAVSIANMAIAGLK